MSLSYNMNVDIPPYHQSERNMTSMNFPSDGNFKQNMSNQMSYQMDPRVDPNMMMQQSQMNMQQPIMMPPPMMMPPQMMMQQPMMQASSMMNNKQPIKKSKNETFNNNSSKCNWLSILKKVIIFTLLFLIMSHVKMNELICRFVPFFNDNEIPCMILKGFIMSILIVVINFII